MVIDELFDSVRIHFGFVLCTKLIIVVTSAMAGGATTTARAGVTVTVIQCVLGTASGKFRQDFSCSGLASGATPLLKVELNPALGKHLSARKLCSTAWAAYSFLVSLLQQTFST